jgi:hypothetical protein
VPRTGPRIVMEATTTSYQGEAGDVYPDVCIFYPAMDQYL